MLHSSAFVLYAPSSPVRSYRQQRATNTTVKLFQSSFSRFPRHRIDNFLRNGGARCFAITGLARGTRRVCARSRENVVEKRKNGGRAEKTRARERAAAVLRLWQFQAAVNPGLGSAARPAGDLSVNVRKSGTRASVVSARRRYDSKGCEERKERWKKREKKKKEGTLARIFSGVITTRARVWKVPCSRGGVSLACKRAVGTFRRKVKFRARVYH